MPSSTDLGYEQAAPDLGYGDATPDSAADLGDCNAAPDLGYGDGTPDSANANANTNADLGYEDAAPAPRRSRGGRSKSPRRLPRKAERRTSAGGLPTPTRRSSSRSPMRRTAPRRSTMDNKLSSAGLSTPSHHSLAPRRSSMKKSSSLDCQSCHSRLGGGEEKQQIKRRVSFGGSATSSVEKQYATEEEKQDIWYNEKELRKLRRKLKKLIRLGSSSSNKEDSEDVECWRGLESALKKAQAAPWAVDDKDQCNQILLKLAGGGADDDTEDSIDDLQSMASKLLRQAMQTSSKQADQDAAEAHAIYMETMDSDLVQSHFPRSASGRAA